MGQSGTTDSLVYEGPFRFPWLKAWSVDSHAEHVDTKITGAAGYKAPKFATASRDTHQGLHLMSSSDTVRTPVFRRNSDIFYYT